MDVLMQVNRKIDILFVIDTAPSMAGEQDKLAVNFRRFAAVSRPSRAACDVSASSPPTRRGGSTWRPHRRWRRRAVPHAADCGIDGPFLVDHDFRRWDREPNYQVSSSFAAWPRCPWHLRVLPADRRAVGHWRPGLPISSATMPSSCWSSSPMAMTARPTIGAVRSAHGPGAADPFRCF
jgi:hypothetical protein